MNRSMKKYTLAVLIAGLMWGFQGAIGRWSAMIGLTKTGTIFLRSGVAALAYLVYLAIKNPRELLVKTQDIWLFLALSLSSNLLYFTMYYNAIELMDLGIVSIFVSTAPAIVVIISFFIFKEKITGRKLIALFLCILGCSLASGVGPGAVINYKGVIFSIGAAFGYASYTVMSKMLLDKGYSGAVIVFYAAFITSLVMIPMCEAGEAISIMFASVPNFLLCIASGMGTCFIADLIYQYGIKHMEAGKASILGTSEMIASIVLAFLIFGERISFVAIIGMILVVSAVYIINTTSEKKDIKG